MIACLTPNARTFPDCKADPQARHLTVPGTQTTLSFRDLPSGDYAVSLIHDENGNGRLDTFAGIPREGVGFSRNPRLGLGAPSFSAARFSVTNGASDQRVQLKYFL